VKIYIILFFLDHFFFGTKKSLDLQKIKNHVATFPYWFDLVKIVPHFIRVYSNWALHPMNIIGCKSLCCLTSSLFSLITSLELGKEIVDMLHKFDELQV
jgi:hypothetical protein